MNWPLMSLGTMKKDVISNIIIKNKRVVTALPRKAKTIINKAVIDPKIKVSGIFFLRKRITGKRKGRIITKWVPQIITNSPISVWKSEIPNGSLLINCTMLEALESICADLIGVLKFKKNGAKRKREDIKIENPLKTEMDRPDNIFFV